MTVATCNDEERINTTRREFLATSIAAAGCIAASTTSVAAATPIQLAPSRLRGSSYDWSKVRGFNYQPSWGINGMEIWMRFDLKTIAIELARGKRYFPHINALRIWLPWDVFRIDQKKFSANLEAYLQLINEQGWQAIPILFNRWQGYPDFGGVYIDHFMPGSLAAGKATIDSHNAYLEATVGRYRSDPRILAWDLCNEPYFNYSAIGQKDDTPVAVAEAETAWLRAIHRKAKSLEPQQPVTIAAHGRHPLQKLAEFSDILTIHPYWIPGLMSLDEFAKQIDEHVAYAHSVGKPLLASECCAGEEDDKKHAEIVRGTLQVLKERGVGWTPHLLHHSLVADAHRSEFGSFSGWYMAFIEANGALRAGHEVFNEF